MTFRSRGERRSSTAPVIDVSVATFPIDHIIPKSLDGLSHASNLALACPHCNAHKSAAVEGFDSLASEHSPYFDPRRQRWSEHFAWSAIAIGELVGRTATGRVTIRGLRVNDSDMVELRVLLSELGLFSEVLAASPV